MGVGAYAHTLKELTWPKDTACRTRVRSVNSLVMQNRTARTYSVSRCEAVSASKMPCWHPVKYFWSVAKHPRTGNPMLTANPIKAINSHVAHTLPCGGCDGCRTDRAQNWATRCTHEAHMHDMNCFITLTYDNDHLPDDFSVHKSVMQDWMKALRHELDPLRVRFFLCGEYGDKNLRPHYHVLLFGYSFLGDRVHYKTGANGEKYYTSAQLTKLWPNGLCDFSDVNYKSAAYVAGYVRKKITGDKAPSHYLRTHPKGHLVQVEPEFALQSRNPGLGSKWYDQYKSDAFPSDFLVIEGKQVPVPRYYANKLSKEELKPILGQRKLKTARQQARTLEGVPLRDTIDVKNQRLAAKQEIREVRMSRLKRSLDEDQQ